MLEWITFTKLADTVVMLPAAMVCMAWLAAGWTWRLAAVWGLMLGTGLLIVAVTKIAFIGWGIGIPSLDFTGISGHTMRAALIMPVMLYLLAHQARPWVRCLAVTAGMAFGFGIGISRLMVHAHSVSEVIAGWMLGVVISLIFIGVLARAEKGTFSSPAFALGLLLLIPAPMSAPAPTERWLEQLALPLSGHDRPFVRSDWKVSRTVHQHAG